MVNIQVETNEFMTVQLEMQRELLESLREEVLDLKDLLQVMALRLRDLHQEDEGDGPVLVGDN